jgi:PPM family protein phosphatase
VTSRRARVRAIAIAALVVASILLISGWIATRAVFFLGTDDDGFVTVYQGVPYDLPAGIPLYSESYVSGLPAAQLAPAQRGEVTEHTWRSRDDALVEIRRLERENRP